MRKLILVRSSVNCTSGFNRIITTNIRKQIDQVRAEINKRFCITIMQGFALPLSLFYAWLHKDFVDYDISTSGFLPKKSTFLLLMRYFFFPHRTSFAGHLAGILVGLMYTMGPLNKIMKACAGW